MLVVYMACQIQHVVTRYGTRFYNSQLAEYLKLFLILIGKAEEYPVEKPKNTPNLEIESFAFEWTSAPIISFMAFFVFDKTFNCSSWNKGLEFDHSLQPVKNDVYHNSVNYDVM